MHGSAQNSIAAATLLDVARKFGEDNYFDACGVVAVPGSGQNFAPLAHFSRWIQEGRAGEMEYLARRNAEGLLLRENILHAMPWARSVLVFASNYRADTPSSLNAHAPDAAWVARYAQTEDQAGRGSDYHDVLLPRLRRIENALHAQLQPQVNEFVSRSFVDTGPIVERVLAAEAGVGWQAKNACLIHPQLGSWIFLGVIATSLELQSAADALAIVPDRCGTCTRCIDACPTHALDTPYWLDASRCIAYLTIEKRGAIPHEFREGIGRHIFGCDICQDVCPWNQRAERHAVYSRDPSLQPRADMINPSLLQLAAMSEAELRDWFRHTPLRRAKFAGLQRNIAIAMGNAALPEFREPLERWAAQTEDPVLAEAAQWSLSKLPPG